MNDSLFSPYNPATFGPLVAASVLTYVEGGKERVASLLRKISRYRIGLWYIPAFIIAPAIIGGVLLMAVITGDPTPELAAPSNLLMIPFAFAYIFFLGGPLRKEFGWSGYALEGLQQRWSVFASSAALTKGV